MTTKHKIMPADLTLTAPPPLPEQYIDWHGAKRRGQILGGLASIALGGFGFIGIMHLITPESFAVKELACFIIGGGVTFFYAMGHIIAND